MASGVVQAAREVAEVQNRFVDYTAPFGAQVDKMKAEKAAARKAKQDANSKHLTEANKYFRKLKDIDYSDYSNEERKILKEWSDKKRFRMWELSNAYATYTNKGAAEAQAIYAEMTDIMNDFANVDAQHTSRLDLKKQYNVDIKGGEFGSDILTQAPQNNVALANTSRVALENFTSIDDNGNMGWDMDGETIGINDAGNYVLRSAELFSWADGEMRQALKRKDPYTEQDIAFKQKQINAYLNAEGALMGVIYDDYFSEYINDDIKDRFDDAYEAGDEEALKGIKEEVAGMVSTAISEKASQAAETYKANNPPKPKGGGGGGYSQSKKDALRRIGIASEPGKQVTIPGQPGKSFIFRSGSKLFVQVDSDGNVKMFGGTPYTLDIEDVADALGVKVREIEKELGI